MSDPAFELSAASATRRMLTSVEAARARLARDGRLHDDAPALRPELPATWLTTLDEAVQRERRDPDPSATARATALLAHYLDRLPAALAEQLCAAAPPTADLFHTPLAWHRLPRLGRALRALARMARRAGVPPQLALGARSPSALSASRPTLAALHAGLCFGASSPLLYATEPDLRTYAAELAAGDPLSAVVDRRLAAPLVHELSHLGRHRVAASPPLIDECISAWLGVLMLPELLWPAPGADNAMMGAAWFAQTGQLLFHLVGRDRLLRAHAGLEPFAALWPGDLHPSLVRLGWERWDLDHAPHFLSGHAEPEPLAKLIWLAAAGRPMASFDLAALRALPLADLATGPPTPADREILTAGLRSMALRTHLRDGAWRVRAAPPAGPVTIDTIQGVLIAPPEPGDHTLPPLRWVLPPSVTQRLRRAGVDRAALAPFDPTHASTIARTLARGRLPR
ncbi:MAG: hypothetical protein R3F39_25010 [Myxococcota bacterium]